MEVKLLWEAAFAVVSLRGNYNLLFFDTALLGVNANISI